MLISKQCYGKFCIANVGLCQYFEYTMHGTMINFVTTLTLCCYRLTVQVVGVAAATGWDQLMGDY